MYFLFTKNNFKILEFYTKTHSKMEHEQKWVVRKMCNSTCQLSSKQTNGSTNSKIFKKKFKRTNLQLIWHINFIHIKLETKQNEYKNWY